MEDRGMDYFRCFRDVCKVINSSLNIVEVLSSITESIVEKLSVKGCTIFLLNKRKKRLEVSTSHGLNEAYLTKGPIDSDKSISDSLNGKSVLIYDASNDARVQYPEEARKEGIASIFSEPIAVKGEVIGVLRIYTSEPRNFNDAEKELISGMAEMGGIAIENARMYSHLKADHERLIYDVHQWFEFGKTE